MSASLKKLLLEEHSKKQCLLIVEYIGADAQKFAHLMELFFHGEYRITQRAAWPMSICVRQHPGLIVPHLTRLIDNLSKPGLHDAVVRNTLRLLQEIKIPKRYHGKLMNACFQYIQTPGVAVAIKAFAITILHHLSDTYPEILPELRLVIDQQIPTGSAAIRQRASKIK